MVLAGRVLTDAPRTFVDVATVWPLADVVAAGDAAVRRRQRRYDQSMIAALQRER